MKILTSKSQDTSMEIKRWLYEEGYLVDICATDIENIPQLVEETGIRTTPTLVDEEGKLYEGVEAVKRKVEECAHEWQKS